MLKIKRVEKTSTTLPELIDGENERKHIRVLSVTYPQTRMFPKTIVVYVLSTTLGCFGKVGKK